MEWKEKKMASAKGDLAATPCKFFVSAGLGILAILEKHYFYFLWFRHDCNHHSTERTNYKTTRICFLNLKLNKFYNTKLKNNLQRTLSINQNFVWPSVGSVCKNHKKIKNTILVALSKKTKAKSKNRKSKNYFLYKYFSCRLKSKQQNALRNY